MYIPTNQCVGLRIDSLARHSCCLTHATYLRVCTAPTHYVLPPHIVYRLRVGPLQVQDGPEHQEARCRYRRIHVSAPGTVTFMNNLHPSHKLKPSRAHIYPSHVSLTHVPPPRMTLPLLACTHLSLSLSLSLSLTHLALSCLSLHACIFLQGPRVLQRRARRRDNKV